MPQYTFKISDLEYRIVNSFDLEETPREAEMEKIIVYL